MNTVKLSRINTILLTLIILINSYIIAAPLIPAVNFWWANRGGTRAAELHKQLHPPKTATASTTPVNHSNSVIIPSMLLDQPINEGPVSQTYAILNKGIWHWPDSSTPDKGSNTVLLGHRFTYTQPKGVLYYLDKVKMNDEIGVWWNNHLYTYRVSAINEVDPSQTSIEGPTSDARLTIFTCTPLWLPHNRLVVVAELENK
ncbi:MAG TPA: class E sortase [Candidatus Microsaccharimonas sp.]|nr:class E sortase [Candidatus Microsaccharimonas sp.]